MLIPQFTFEQGVTKRIIQTSKRLSAATRIYELLRVRPAHTPEHYVYRELFASDLHESKEHELDLNASLYIK